MAKKKLKKAKTGKKRAKKPLPKKVRGSSNLLASAALKQRNAALDFLARFTIAVRSNHKILMAALHGDYAPTDKLDDIGFGDPMRRLRLTQDLTLAGVPVDPAFIDVAETVGAVEGHMDQIKSEWAP
jgi:hypothetical protein